MRRNVEYVQGFSPLVAIRVLRLNIRLSLKWVFGQFAFQTFVLCIDPLFMKIFGAPPRMADLRHRLRGTLALATSIQLMLSFAIH